MIVSLEVMSSLKITSKADRHKVYFCDLPHLVFRPARNRGVAGSCLVMTGGAGDQDNLLARDEG